MRFRQGIQAEVLLSLALVMVTGAGLLAGVFLELNQSRVEALHTLLGRGLLAEVQRPGFEVHPFDSGSWWKVDESGRVSGLNVSADRLDPATLALGREAIAMNRLLVHSGAPWHPTRFASPSRNGRSVFVGRIDAPVSGVVLATLVIAQILIFCCFGVTLLQRRVVGPLRRLVVAVRDAGEGDLPANVPVDGVREIADLGSAFNDMQAALASRTGALEKAVFELRSSNADLLQARDGLDRAERLAVVGGLAAGVAHEVGNPMGALLAFLDVAARDEGLSAEGRRCLDKASEQGERVRVILRQLLDFSRPPRVEHGPIVFADVARQVVELVSAQREFSTIEFELRESADLPEAHGDQSLSSQILLNLVLNAAWATAESPTRRIHIDIAPDVMRRRAEDVASDHLVQHADARLGRDGDGPRADAIACRVQDSGPGVANENRIRIFDPFFTTRDPGEGTGLGLANARRLAEEMGGRVELDPEASVLGGASFRFVLPTGAEESRCETAGVRVNLECRNP